MAERVLGRKLRPGEIVHHRNEKKDDNKPLNLEVKPNSVHSREHALERAAPRIALVCSVCGEVFEKLPSKFRYALLCGTEMYCSRRCSGRGSRAKQLGTMHVPAHGTLSGYTRCPKPRCDECKAAMRDWKRRWRAKRAAKTPS